MFEVKSRFFASKEVPQLFYNDFASCPVDTLRCASVSDGLDWLKHSREEIELPGPCNSYLPVGKATTTATTTLWL